jgi:TetR/AcrR family transcriptional regulator, repressor for uid operon
MPKLKPETQAARREHILDAAQQCFVRSGFHRTTIQDICTEARVSLGALYVYFDSKEALIQGICERDRAEFSQDFSALSAAPDFFAAVHAMGQKLLIDEPRSRRLMCFEIGVEATRNPRVAEVFERVDAYILTSFADLFARMQQEGRIAPGVDTAALASAFIVIGDGLFWRRALHTAFDIRAVMPVLLHMLGAAMQSSPSHSLAPSVPPHSIPPSLEPETAS